jgi:hypothetical protein
MEDVPFFFLKKKCCLKILAAFWFFELEDAEIQGVYVDRI